MSATSFQNQYDKIKQEHPEWLEPVSEHKWAEAGKQASEAFKKLKEMEEKEFTKQDMQLFGYYCLTNHNLKDDENFTLAGNDIITGHGVWILKEFLKSKQQKQYPEGIREVRNKKGDFISPVYAHEYQKWCNGYLGQENCEIWSVQNGNEVLTVGDTVKFRYGEEFKIETFKIKETDIFACTENETTRYLVHPNNLRKVVHQPIFQISGKDVMVDDTYYRVHLGAALINGDFDFEEAHAHKESYFNPEVYKYFLTRTEAQEWIEDNRPQYSKAQLKQCFNYSKAKTTMQFGKDNLKDFIHSEYTFENYEKDFLPLLKNKTQTS